MSDQENPVNSGNAWLFLAAALLWGTGALATSFQAGPTAAAYSVAFRMAIASAFFFAAAATRGVALRVPSRDWIFVFIQGAAFFAIGFIGFYQSTRLIPSGLSTLILSTSSIFAAVAAWVFMGIRLRWTVIAASLLGVAGIAVIFLPGGLDQYAQVPAGLAWGFVAAIGTALGTVLGSRNNQAGLPALTTLAWATLTGAIVSICWAAISGEPLALDLTMRYWLSLLYLALAASFLAFLLYFKLVARIGPARAAYALVTVPLIAVLLSVLFEGLQIHWSLLLGGLLIVVGNVIVLRY